ncbi:unnamed protein product [Choristocarpus tenellus]
MPTQEVEMKVNSTMDNDDSEDEDEIAYGTMARFVPTLVLERLRDVGEASMVAKSAGGGEAIPDRANKPHMHELDAVVMMVDVSGFSSMCESFALGLHTGPTDRLHGQKNKATPDVQATRSRRNTVASAGAVTSLYRLANEREKKGFGAEGVRDALNQKLGALISKVEEYGGDVLRIAGDALIVLFHQGKAGVDPWELTELCLTCSRCGWTCARSIDPTGGDNDEGLSVHVGIGCGKVDCFNVGSDKLGWQLVVSGELFKKQVAKALDAASAGEVVVSGEVWQRLAGTGWGSKPIGERLYGLRVLDWDPVDNTLDREANVQAVPAHGNELFVALNDTELNPNLERISRARASHSVPGAMVSTKEEGPWGGMPSRRSFQRSGSCDSTFFGNKTQIGTRWCPSRRRVSLLEEVDTGVMTMLSSKVGRALKGYCPQPVREGLVAERLGLLAELQRVAVMFVGMSFEGPTSESPLLPWTGSGQGSMGMGPVEEGNGPGPILGQGLEKWPGDVQRVVEGQGHGEEQGEQERRGQGLSAYQGLDLSLLQDSFAFLQSIVAGHEGVIKELSVDDKGMVLVVGFGLSPHVGHLPAARAVLCALECTDRLKLRGLADCTAGVATGPVFCGSLGSDIRREFAMVSDTVNLAMRLMSARKKGKLQPKDLVVAAASATRRRMRTASETSSQGSTQDSMLDLFPTTALGSARAGRSLAGVQEGTTEVEHDRVIGVVGCTGGGFSTPVHRRSHCRRGEARIQHQGAYASMLASVRLGAFGRGERSKESVSYSPRKVTTPLSATAPQKVLSSSRGLGAEDFSRGNSLDTDYIDPWEPWWEDFSCKVVLDTETHAEARLCSQLVFLELKEIKVKGKKEAVQLYAPGLSEDLETGSVGATEELPNHNVRGGEHGPLGWQEKTVVTEAESAAIVTEASFLDKSARYRMVMPVALEDWSLKAKSVPVNHGMEIRTGSELDNLPGW